MTKTTFKLTDAQQKIYDGVVDSVKNYSGRFDCVVRGYAGTGKSTTIARIIKKLNNMGSVAVTSPTHKANHVLKDMLASEGIEGDTEVMTIHSFLGLKLVNKKQKQVLEYDPHSPNSKRLVDVLIIDECSMISSDMYMHIIKQSHRVRRAIIFVGDECQLSPVEPEKPGTIVSCSFGHGAQFALTEVLRQALDNPILALATEIRGSIDSGVNPLSHIYAIPDNCETVIKTSDIYGYQDSYFSMITEGGDNYTVDLINDNVLKYKMLSYTNRNVDEMNRAMRARLFPDANEEFIVGEPVVFDEATLNCPYTNQQIVECPSVTKDTWMGIKCWRVESSDGSSFYMVGPQTKHAYQQQLQQIVTQIQLKATNPYTKKPYNWGDYYIIKEKMNVVGYPYATTYHRSQGSTFDVIWMDLEYVSRVQNLDDMSRMLYTAVTRPRDALIIKI